MHMPFCRPAGHTGFDFMLGDDARHQHGKLDDTPRFWHAVAFICSAVASTPRKGRVRSPYRMPRFSGFRIGNAAPEGIITMAARAAAHDRRLNA